MKISDCCNIPKGQIAVLGAKSNSYFIKLLCAELNLRGTVEISNKVLSKCDADYSLILLDEKKDRIFSAHSDFPEASFKIGCVDVSIFEKPVKDVVNNLELFCKIADTNENQLVYPFMLAKVIKNNEKYDLLFVDNVVNESNKYIARELSKCLSMAICIGSSKNNEVEILRKVD